MLLPFIVRFSQLRDVNFETSPNGTLVTESEYAEDGTSLIQSLIDAFSGGFAAGALSHNLRVHGLICPNLIINTFQPNAFCATCRRVIRCFPIKQAVDFGRCSLVNREVVAIIQSRPDGQEYLLSTDRLFHLLSHGLCNRENITAREVEFAVDSTPTDHTIHTVSYNPDDLDEIEHICQHGIFDVGSLSAFDCVSAIMRSTVIGRWAPQKQLCFIDEVSFDRLVSYGIPIGKNLLTPCVERVQNAVPRLDAHSKANRRPFACITSKHWNSRIDNCRGIVGF
jgi:hypothetical protein